MSKFLNYIACCLNFACKTTIGLSFELVGIIPTILITYLAPLYNIFGISQYTDNDAFRYILVFLICCFLIFIFRFLLHAPYHFYKEQSKEILDLKKELELRSHEDSVWIEFEQIMFPEGTPDTNSAKIMQLQGGTSLKPIGLGTAMSWNDNKKNWPFENSNGYVCKVSNQSDTSLKDVTALIKVDYRENTVINDNVQQSGEVIDREERKIIIPLLKPNGEDPYIFFIYNVGEYWALINPIEQIQFNILNSDNIIKRKPKVTYNQQYSGAATFSPIKLKQFPPLRD